MKQYSANFQKKLAHYPNAYRSPRERRLIYCYLRQVGLDWKLAKFIACRSKSKIAQTLENLDYSMITKLQEVKK